MIQDSVAAGKSSWIERNEDIGPTAHVQCARRRATGDGLRLSVDSLDIHRDHTRAAGRKNKGEGRGKLKEAAAGRVAGRKEGLLAVDTVGNDDVNAGYVEGWTQRGGITIDLNNHIRVVRARLR